MHISSNILLNFQAEYRLSYRKHLKQTVLFNNGTHKLEAGRRNKGEWQSQQRMMEREGQCQVAEVINIVVFFKSKLLLHL